MVESMIGWLIPFMSSNPHLAVLITIMGVSRTVFKPACALIQTYVDSTPSVIDNEKWKKIQEGKYFKALAYGMDFFLSIKLPVK